MSTVTISDSTPTMSRRSHAEDLRDVWPALAWLRFFLAAIVLFSHTASYSQAPGFVNKIWHMGAQAAVLCFFIVSGFSIAHSIIERPEGFYWRRILRIYPIFTIAYLLANYAVIKWGPVITVYGPTGSALLHPPSLLSRIGSFFLLNDVLVDRFEALGIAWTLSIEFLFYWLAPLFVQMSTRLLVGLIAISGGFHLLHQQLIHDRYLAELNHGEAAIFLLWPWLLGFLYYRLREQRWAQASVILVPSLLISYWCADYAEHALLTCVITTCVLVFPPRVGPAAAKALNYLGDLSYPLYILQGSLFAILLGGNTPRHYYLLLLVPIAASLLAYHLIDYPIRKAQRAARVKPA